MALNHKSYNVHQTKRCLECILSISSLPDLPSSGSFLTGHVLQRAVRADACMYVRCSPPVISYLCLRLHQPASSPATSQPTSISLLLGQRLSRGYFFCFSHLLSFILLSISSFFIPSAIFLAIDMSVCLSPHVSFYRTPFLSLVLSLSLSLILLKMDRLH